MVKRYEQGRRAGLRVTHLSFLACGLGCMTQLLGAVPQGTSRNMVVNGGGVPTAGTQSCWATQTIIVGSAFPAGWVITNEQVSGTTSYYTILNVSCAKFQDTETVLAGSPIPDNWVKTNEQSDGLHTYFVIKYLKGAPYLDTEQVLSYSPIPSGWVIIGQQSDGVRTYYTIQNQNPPNTVKATIVSPASDQTIASATAVSFVGTATDSAADATLTYSWNFGDGHVVTGAAVSHSFSNTGTANAAYKVELRVTDSTGVTASAYRTITVTPAPRVSVSISPGAIDLFVPTRYPIDPIKGEPVPAPAAASYQFQAGVQNSADQSVTWSISPAIGSISSTGFYSVLGDLPSVLAYLKTVTVTATSKADPTRSATATITLHGGVQN